MGVCVFVCPRRSGNAAREEREVNPALGVGVTPDFAAVGDLLQHGLPSLDSAPFFASAEDATSLQYVAAQLRAGLVSAFASPQRCLSSACRLQRQCCLYAVGTSERAVRPAVNVLATDTVRLFACFISILRLFVFLRSFIISGCCLIDVCCRDLCVRSGRVRHNHEAKVLIPSFIDILCRMR